MKKLIIILITSLIFTYAYAVETEHIPKETPKAHFFIGVAYETDENMQLYLQTGQLVISPVNFKEAIMTIAQDGFICDMYGHNFEAGYCKLCGHEETLFDVSK